MFRIVQYQKNYNYMKWIDHEDLLKKGKSWNIFFMMREIKQNNRQKFYSKIQRGKGEQGTFCIEANI